MSGTKSLPDVGARPVRFVAERALAVMTAVHDGADAAAVTSILESHGEDVSPSLSPRDVTDLAGVVEDLWRLVHLSSVEEWARALNTLLARWTGPPRLVHEGIGWHLHVDQGNETSWAQWLGSSTVFAFAVLLAEHDEPPVALCADEGCARPFVRSGRGKVRRFCSSRCATRSRVREHRQQRTKN